MTACSSKQNASDVAAEEGITARIFTLAKACSKMQTNIKQPKTGPKFNYKFQEHVVGIGVDIEVTEVHGGKKPIPLGVRWIRSDDFQSRVIN